MIKIYICWLDNCPVKFTIRVKIRVRTCTIVNVTICGTFYFFNELIGNLEATNHFTERNKMNKCEILTSSWTSWLTDGSGSVVVSVMLPDAAFFALTSVGEGSRVRTSTMSCSVKATKLATSISWKTCQLFPLAILEKCDLWYSLKVNTRYLL